MWPFNRKKKVQQSTAPEVKEYYRAEKRDRLWGVWLLSLATFFGTLIIVLGLFWIGRWTYHKVADKNHGATVSVEQKPQASKPSSNNSSNGADNKTNQNSSNSSNGTSTTPAPSTTPPATTPATGASNSNTQLINTGPTSDD